jgi:FdrA protein
MVVTSRTLADAYQDSVKLMRIASDVADTFEVEETLAVMATEENQSMVVEAGLLEAADLSGLDPNDLLLVVEADDEATAESAIEDMVERLRGSTAIGSGDATGAAPAPQSIASAVNRLRGANLALVSLPGEYAAREAWKAIHRGLHVHLFSDNVPLEEERALKHAALEAGQLVMGPDCGTAIINGVPLGFANEVERGSVGLVAAAGTGLQEVTSLVDRAGAGVSQAIGTGGRDLSAAVGGLTMRQGLGLLAEDPETEVVVLLSKPPDPEALDPLLESIEGCEKPVIVDFIDAEDAAVSSVGGTKADTLADAARLAVEATANPDGHVTFDDGVPRLADPSDAVSIAADLDTPAPERSDLRGLFTGGTFALEARSLLAGRFDSVGSNLGTGRDLEDPLNPSGHAIVDLGADEFTRGRAHPMIDPTLRTEQLEAALEDPSARIVLLDVVLGHGAYEDPAGPVADVVAETRTGDWPQVVASVCGTRGDPQGWPAQVDRLADAGVQVAESNAAAARLGVELWTAADGTRGADQ